MTSDPFKDARDRVERTESRFSLGLARVVTAPADSGHQVAIQPLTQTSGDTETKPRAATVLVAELGDVEIPPEGSMVVFGRLGDGRYVVIGNVYDQDSTPPSYQPGQRTVGHDLTDAHITIEPDGDITIESAPGKAVTIDGIKIRSSTDNPLSVPHTEWSSSLSEEEIWRVELGAGEEMRIFRLEVALKGGGSADLTLDLYDVDQGTVLASTDGGSPVAGDPVATSGTGSTVIARMDNATGSRQIAAISSQIAIIES